MTVDATAHSPAQTSRVRMLAKVTLPALVIGAMCGVLLWAIDEAAEGVTVVMWEWLPEVTGIDPEARWWPIVVLGLAGLAVGTVIRYVPGHGGYDSATTELVAPPLPLKALPGIALALIISLGAGVSLGPESPIISIAVGLSVWGVARILPEAGHGQILLVAGAGMVGAMFGSPVAAALLLTEMVAGLKGGGLLWDKLFAPVAAAASGALVAHWLGVAFTPGGDSDYTGPSLMDLAVGIPVAVVAAVASLAGAWLMPKLWHLLRRYPNPIVFTTIGGLVLGVLGSIGGHITLFKGAAETGELIERASEFSFWALLGLAFIKVAALTVSAASGFRGGRIFPAVFIGSAFGLAGHALVPDSSLSLALAAGAMGSILAVGRDGWLAIFMGVALVGDVTVLPMMCVIVLPVWLFVTSGPEMLVHGATVPPKAGHAAPPEPPQ
ncbi:ion channel protein [Demequina sp. B12]|uniref:ion channel protein n=1 Tax=Demequina sp. B12 TaxID=2992757 RepID=UPI00237A7D94|nr:ion channel protein [Demequina sp. B12]MDE0573586.1 ion channel protein [Demequina sp. B12]